MSVTVILIPGYLNSGPDHWQTLWQLVFPQHVRVRQLDWNHPRRQAWIDGLHSALRSCQGPVVFAAHSLGCTTLAAWCRQAEPESLARVRGALLVAPPELDRPDCLPALHDFQGIPATRLPFPSRLIASSNDPYSSLAASEQLAKDWGSQFTLLGPCGHINGESNLGTWPEGQDWLRLLMSTAA